MKPSIEIMSRLWGSAFVLTTDVFHSPVRLYEFLQEWMPELNKKEKKNTLNSKSVEESVWLYSFKETVSPNKYIQWGANERVLG